MAVIRRDPLRRRSESAPTPGRSPPAEARPALPGPDLGDSARRRGLGPRRNGPRLDAAGLHRLDGPGLHHLGGGGGAFPPGLSGPRVSSGASGRSPGMPACGTGPPPASGGRRSSSASHALSDATGDRRRGGLLPRRDGGRQECSTSRQEDTLSGRAIYRIARSEAVSRPTGWCSIPGKHRHRALPAAASSSARAACRRSPSSTASPGDVWRYYSITRTGRSCQPVDRRDARHPPPPNRAVGVIPTPRGHPDGQGASRGADDPVGGRLPFPGATSRSG